MGTNARTPRLDNDGAPLPAPFSVLWERITKDKLQGAIVALKKDGEWITDAEPDKGSIRLVCPQTPANGWVFQLQTVYVNE